MLLFYLLVGAVALYVAHNGWRSLKGKSSADLAQLVSNGIGIVVAIFGVFLAMTGRAQSGIETILISLLLFLPWRNLIARWRGEAAPAEDGRAGRRPPPPDTGPMTVDEAYRVLGLEPGADDAAIREAYRRLMVRMHPDQGGSTYLAAKINQAKDLLLGRGRG